MFSRILEVFHIAHLNLETNIHHVGFSFNILDSNIITKANNRPMLSSEGGKVVRATLRLFFFVVLRRISG